MSNERFDRLMKKNLESVRPAYQPRAWDRFQKRLPVISFWPWLTNYGGWVLSGLMLTGWLVTGYTLRENQQLLRRLTSVNIPAKRPQQPATSITTADGRLTHRVDTVYIIRQTIVQHRYAQNRMNVPAAGQEGDAGTVAGIPRNTLLHPVPFTLSTVPTRSKIVRNEPGNQPSTVASQPVLLPPATASASAFARSQDQLPTSADSINQAIKLATAAISIDSTLTAVSSKPAVASGDSASHHSINTAVSTTATQQSQPELQRRQPFTLASLQPRVGIETIIMPEGAAGIGPAIELFPAENLGISLGVVASQFQSENHQGLKDYNQTTGKAFDEQYRAYLPAQYDRIEDITIRTSVISLPVTLKYYVPLRPRWTLLMQAGSSFDLAAFQEVRYESYFQQEDQFHSFESPVVPRLFHNFTFGAGIQYQRNRISAQLSPYYLYDFRNIADTPAGSNVGIKGGVWLNLYK